MQKVISTLQADKEVNKAFSTLSTGSKLEIKWSDAQNINVDGENANITAADSEGTPAIIDAGISRDFIKKVAELLPDGLPESKSGGTFYITIEKSADNEMVYNVHSTSTLDTSEPTIPNGDTITTLNDVQTWLKCAGITNKNYTTVAEVCSDDEVLTALMDNENAMTYLTSSIDFVTDICSNELAMTRLGDSKYCDDSVLNR